MATLIGTVRQVVGEVFAVAEDGGRRPLSAGDAVFAGERILTTDGAAVGIDLVQGGELTLGRETDFLLTEQLQADAQDGEASAAPTAAALADVEALQQAIEAGEDPTLNAPAPAAGPAAGGAGAAGGGHSFVLLDAVGGALEPVIGFPTQGLGSVPEFPQPEPAAAIETPEQPPIDGVPIAVDDASSLSEDIPSVLGNVLSNDIPGLDGGIRVVTSGTTAGDYGQLTLNADGSFSYVLNTGLAAVQGLDNGEQLSDTFNYTMQDADGDPSTAQLTITITGSNDAPSLSVIGAQVFEAGLAAGSDAGASSEFASGSFTLGDTDGLDDIQSVSINGTTVAMDSLVGSSFAGAHGTLTVTGYDKLTGIASYQYQLTSPTTDLADIDESETFSVSVSDGTNSASGSLVIDIVDDLPSAANDAFNLSEDVASVIGNVLSNDTSGADVSAAVTSIGNQAGNYGQLTLNGDGSFSYVLNTGLAAVQGLDNGEQLSETFSYTMQDADGDPSTAQLTVTITGSNDAPSLSVIGAQVFEAGLAAGSDAGASSEFASGSFTLGDTDGLDDLQSVSINGTTVAMDSLVGSSFAGAHGTLTVTGYDKLTGIASYQYQLTSPTTDLADVDESETFSVSVSDGTNSASGSLVIDIVDDLPSAANDAFNLSEDVASVIGNVLSNDTSGADLSASVSSTGNQAGNYGQLTLNADGSFSYVLNTGLAAVQGLDNGEQLSETFSYTMQDADGDPSTAQLTVTITGNNDTPSLSVIGAQVFEAGLAAGSDAGASSEFASGTFTFGDVDGLDDLQSVSINGTTVAMGSLVGSSFAGAHGSLTVTGYDALTGITTYQYQLTSPTIDVAGVDESDTFSVVVSDGTNSASGSLVIDIVDDLPSAANDAFNLSEDVASVIGNVLSNDTSGADVSSAVTSIGNQAGSYGQLTLNADGSFSYVLNTGLAAVQGLDNGEQLSETFSYTMQDADGDPSTAQLTVTITGSNDSPSLSVIGAQVFEAGLATGSDAGASSEFASGSFTLGDVDGLDDIQSVSINGTSVALGSLVGSSFAGAHGSLTVTGYDGLSGIATYQYQLTSPTTDLAGTESDSFSVSVSDGTASASGSLLIDIVDDLPSAANDAFSLSEDVASVIGNVLSNDTSGADLSAAVTSTGDQAGNYGQLTLNADGSFSYVLNTGLAAVQGLDNGEQLSETFSYTMQDADGDPSTAQLTITITGSNDAPSLSVIGAQVFEAGLAAGSDAGASSEFASGSFTLGDTDGLDDIQSVSINGTSVALGSLVGSSFAGAHGTLTVTGYDGLTGIATYQYQLTSPTTDLAGTESDSFSVSVSDGTNSASGNLLIDIVDDLPDAANDAFSLSEDVASVIGNVLSNDTSGADVSAAVTSIGNQAGNYGQLTLNGDGSFSYVLNTGLAAVQGLDNGEQLSETFSYTMQDADGDPSTAQLTVTITGNNDTPSLSVIGAQVFEAGLATGSDAAANSEFAYGSFTLGDTDGLDDLQSVSINGTSVALGSLVGSSFAGTHGTLTVTGYDELSGIASYQYQLTRPTTDLADVDESDTFSVSVSDGTSSADSSLVIGVVDDMPELGAFTTAIIPNEIGAVNGTFSVVSGADGLNGFDITGPAIAGLNYATVHNYDGTGNFLSSTLTGLTSGNQAVFSLTVNANGTYVFNLLQPEAASELTYSLNNLAPGHVPGLAETLDGLIEFSSSGAVNSSAQGFGIDNQFFDRGEQFTMEFHAVGLPGGDVRLVDRVVLVNDQVSGELTVRWTATNSQTGESRSGTLTVTGTMAETVIDPDISFNQLQLEGIAGNGKVRFATTTISTLVLPEDQSLAFDIVAQDGDGDFSASSTLNVQVVAEDSMTSFVLEGSAGDDVIAASSLTDIIDGKAGFDIVDYGDDAAGVAASLAAGAGLSGIALGDSYNAIEGLMGGSGSDQLAGDDQANYLAGGAGDDILQGGAGDDMLLGDLGDDLLSGGAGDDVLAGDAGSDQLLGGEGFDTADYGADTAGITVSLESGSGMGGFAAGDTYDSIEGIVGGAGDDQLTGNAQTNYLEGGAGDDFLSGGAGDDVLVGGLGDDAMSGGAGRDSFVWRAEDAGGTDTISDFYIDPTGANSDVIDLSELLSAVDTDGGGLDGYLNFAFGESTTISISLTPGGESVQDITLSGLDLSSFYGTSDEAAVIANLIDDNALKVDNA